MAVPIFLIGWRRSGTTWLGALISRHPKVAAVLGGAPGQKGGIVESSFFSHFAGRFGDLRNHSNLIALTEVFSASTYFYLSGLDKGIFYETRPVTYHDFFKIFMDRLAENSGADYWLEKTPAHSFHVQEIAAAYPEACFISIKRDLEPQVRSAMTVMPRMGLMAEDAGGFQRFYMILREVLAYHGAYKQIDKLKKRNPDRVFEVNFSDLIGSRREVMMEICRFVDLDFREEMLENVFKPATLYNSEKEKNEAITPFETKLVRFLDTVLDYPPHLFFRLLFELREKKIPFNMPYWQFTPIMEKYNWTDLLDENRTRDTDYGPATEDARLEQ